MSGFPTPSGAGGSSPIKSIQRGSVTATNGSTGTVTVTAVDTSKSVLLVSPRNGLAVGISSVVSFDTLASMKLTDATTLTWNGGYVSSYTSVENTHSVIEWQLVEYK